MTPEKLKRLGELPNGWQIRRGKGLNKTRQDKTQDKQIVANPANKAREGEARQGKERKKEIVS